MQTFLPYADFKKSASILDNKRLGKQRSEAKTILEIISGRARYKAWRNHPAVLMWAGYEGALAEYGVAICTEWRRRGFRDSLLPYFLKFKRKSKKPFWLGSSKFHKSHRSNLLRKDFDYYSKYFKIRSDLAYYWPTSGNRNIYKPIELVN